MLVAGAIAATCAAMVMNTPAEAARAPVGATYTTTGTSEARMLCTIERIDRSRPPGVLSWRISACAPSARARSIAEESSRAVIGLIALSISISETGATDAGEARRSQENPDEHEEEGKRPGDAPGSSQLPAV